MTPWTSFTMKWNNAAAHLVSTFSRRKLSGEPDRVDLPEVIYCVSDVSPSDRRQWGITYNVLTPPEKKSSSEWDVIAKPPPPTRWLAFDAPWQLVPSPPLPSFTDCGEPPFDWHLNSQITRHTVWMAGDEREHGVQVHWFLENVEAKARRVYLYGTCHTLRLYVMH